MSKAKPTPMTREAVSRIAAATAKQHHGKTPAKSFVSRADADLQRQAAAQVPKKP